ncbi:hypothetical protein [Bacillus infantis]|nr:hypothetical protein [Bacillus infantis]
MTGKVTPRNRTFANGNIVLSPEDTIEKI